LAYPSGWRLDADEGELDLLSPDPRDMMFDNQLACERGSGLPKVGDTEEAPVLFKGSFYRTKTGWLAATGLSGDCEGDGCEVPATRQLGGVTFMRVDIEYRGHGPWGYRGLAAAREHLIVAGAEWVHCIDGVLDSDTRIEPAGARRRPRE
jgi:hypothetical protein